MHNFGARLKELREAAGWTQKELGDRSGVSVYAIRGYEQDVRHPNWRVFLDLCKALSVEPSRFDDCRLDAEAPPAKIGKPRRRA